MLQMQLRYPAVSWSMPRMGSEAKGRCVRHSQEQGRWCSEEKKQSFKSISQAEYREVREGTETVSRTTDSCDRDTIKPYLEITEIKGGGPWLQCRGSQLHRAEKVKADNKERRKHSGHFILYSKMRARYQHRAGFLQKLPGPRKAVGMRSLFTP